MVSPARKCHLRKAAAVAATAASVATETLDASPYELLRQVLGNCLVELKGIQSIEAKIERKRTMLPDFTPWTDGILEAAAKAREAGETFTAPADDVLSQVLVWSLDTQDFDRALPLAEHVLRYGLALPERFKRTAGTMVAEEIAEAGLKAAAQGEAFPLDVLQQVDELTAREDMHDQVRAKLKKAIGLELARQAELAGDNDTNGPAGGKRALVAAALEALKRALELHEKSGVKKNIERLEAEAKRLAAPKE